MNPQCQSIAQAIGRKIGRGCYHPDRPIKINRPLPPRTVRELIEREAPEETDRQRGVRRWTPDLSALSGAAGRLDRSGIPVDVRILSRRRCRAPIQIDPGYSLSLWDLQTTCRGFWNWFKKYRRRDLPDIDRPISDDLPGWPLLAAMNRQFRQRGNCCLDDLFGMDFWFNDAEGSNCGLTAYVPLYDLNDSSDATPLMEFLQERITEFFCRRAGCLLTWPQACCEIFPESVSEEDAAAKLRTAESVMTEILRQRRWGLLPADWRAACRGICRYVESNVRTAGQFTFYDYEQCRWEIGEDADELEELMKSLEQIDACWKSIHPLMIACKDAEKFWRRILDHLMKVGRRHPEMKQSTGKKQSKALIEVLV